jgi:two-component system sensor histidine kinase/response regulator
LHGISGIVELLLRHRDGMDDTEIDEFLGLAQQSTKRLERLIHRFLLGLQLGLVAEEKQASTPAVRPNVTLPTDFLVRCAKEQSQAAQREGDLELSLPLATILADPEDLTFIIEELLGNAFKFSDPGKPVTVSGETVGNDLELKITDRGRGMTKDQMDRIGAFMQFDRGHYEQQGIGLGLEIVKKLTACHQWRFSMTSTVGLGTEVGIGLPLASPATGLPRGG